MQLRGQEPVSEGTARGIRDWAKIETWPEKGIEVGYDDPGTLTIKSEMLFHSRWYFDGDSGRFWFDMRNRRHDDFSDAGRVVNGNDDDARPALRPFVKAGLVFVPPQIVTDSRSGRPALARAPETTLMHPAVAMGITRRVSGPDERAPDPFARS
ncbi:MAG: hypothetical protein BroJett029_16900 [Alphaproteobacteria bacterium]|nr:MAG: hypothetical protein BroJett029_16900 [Alphaproteobacteria bacterium]